MSKPKLQEVIEQSAVAVHPGRYAYLKGVESVIGNHFMVSRDQDETTIVTEEANVASVQHNELVGWFVLVEVKVSTPFVTVGFLASIASAIAKEELNVLIVSTFSKDYLLLREETITQGLKVLKDIGFTVESTGYLKS